MKINSKNKEILVFFKLQGINKIGTQLVKNNDQIIIFLEASNNMDFSLNTNKAIKKEHKKAQK